MREVEEFLMSGLNACNVYDIRLRNGKLIVQHKPGVIEVPRIFQIRMHSRKIPISQLVSEDEDTSRKGIYTVDIFYDNPELFRARLENSEKKRLSVGSLKKYKDRIDEIIKLTVQEKYVLRKQNNRTPRLIYYVPGLMMDEKVELINPQPVELDYSYMPTFKFGGIRPTNRISRDYVLEIRVKELLRNRPIRMVYPQNGSSQTAIIDLLETTF